MSLVALDEPSEGEQVIERGNGARGTQDARGGRAAGRYRNQGGGRPAIESRARPGTAWKFAAGGYSEDKYISIFAGLAPATDPRLAAVVVIDEPSGELYYGSDVAAPVFADVMSESLRLLAVPPDALPARDPGSIMQAMSQ